MSSTANDQPKVVYISTHYVETDPLSFKSVVQSLTGKESSSTATEEGGGAGAMLGKPGAFSCGDFTKALLEITPPSEELVNSVYGDLLFNSHQQGWVTTTNL